MPITVRSITVLLSTSFSTCFERHDKMDKMLMVMVPMSTDQVESHTARKFRRWSVCLAPVDVQMMLLSASSIGILPPVVAISVTSKRRPPRPRSPPPSAPLHLRTAATTQLPAQVGKQVVETHSSRIERHAARVGAQSGRWAQGE